MNASDESRDRDEGEKMEAARKEKAGYCDRREQEKTGEVAGHELHAREPLSPVQISFKWVDYVLLLCHW